MPANGQAGLDVIGIAMCKVESHGYAVAAYYKLTFDFLSPNRSSYTVADNRLMTLSLEQT